MRWVDGGKGPGWQAQLRPRRPHRTGGVSSLPPRRRRACHHSAGGGRDAGAGAGLHTGRRPGVHSVGRSAAAAGAAVGSGGCAAWRMRPALAACCPTASCFMPPLMKLALLCALCLCRCAEQAGLTVDQVAPRLSFFFAVGMNFFSEARRRRPLWPAALCLLCCGALRCIALLALPDAAPPNCPPRLPALPALPADCQAARGAEAVGAPGQGKV